MSGIAHVIDHLIERHGVTLTIEEAAGVLRIDPATLVRLIDEGRFPCAEVNRAEASRCTRRIAVWAIADWIEAGGTGQFDEEQDAEPAAPAKRAASRSDYASELRRRERMLASVA